MNLDHMTGALPQSFEFYHLGKVEIAPWQPSDSNALNDEILQRPLHSIAFTIIDEDLSRGVLLVLFDSALDLSTYSELGNTLASQIATRLSQTSGFDAWISPPKVLNPVQLKRLLQLRNHEHSEDRTYVQNNGETRTTIQTVLMMLPPAVSSTDFLPDDSNSPDIEKELGRA